MKNKIQGIIPNIFAISFILFLFYFSYSSYDFSVNILSNIRSLSSLIYALWIFSEMGITANETKESDTIKDGKSLEFYALSRGITVTVTLLNSSGVTHNSALFFLGLMIFFCGVGLRFWAISSLGKFYSHRVREKSGHEIITTGPYKLLRHPAYSGMLCANLGFVFMFFSIPAVATFLILFVSAIVYRINKEEKMLFNMKNYSQVMKDKYRLVPFIW